MKKTFSRVHKKLLCFVVALAVVATTVLGSSMSSVISADAATYETLSLTDKGSMKCPEVGVASPHDLWYMNLGGHQVICLTPGGHARTGDVYKVTPTNPMTYSYNGSTEKGKDMARALAYYSGLGYSVKNHQAIQSFLWATAKGEDTATAIQQSTGWSASDAKSFVNAVEATPVYGTLYVGTVSSCPHGKSSRSQILIRWAPQSFIDTPEYDSVTLTDSKTESKDLAVTITKKDSESQSLIDTAKFEVYIDGNSIRASDLKTLLSGSSSGSKFSTSNGKVQFTYTRTYTVEEQSSKTVWYVKNWTEINEVQQANALKSGYHSNKANATAEAQADLNTKLSSAMASLKAQSHTWKVVETNSPDGHALDANSVQTLTETGSTNSLSYTFYNGPQRGYIEIIKTNSYDGTSEDYGFEADGAAALNANKETDFSGATYQILARGTIYDHNGNIAYEKGDVVQEVVLDSTGYGKSTALYEGKYYVQETEPPKGMELNKQKYPAVIDIADNELTTTIEIAAEDAESTYGFKASKVTMDYNIITDADGNPTEFEEVENIETNATFDLYYLNGSEYVKVKTYTTNEDGEFGQEDGLLLGKYRLVQTSGSDGYSLVEPIEFEILESNVEDLGVDYGRNYGVDLGKIENIGPIPDWGMIKIQKTWELVDPENITTVIDYGPEENAVFDIVDSNGAVVDTITTGADGKGKSKPLDAGTYTLVQTSGKDGYTMIEDDENVIVTAGVITERAYTDRGPVLKVKIQKNKVDGNQKEAEAGAEFYVFDPNVAEAAGISLDNFPTDTLERRNFVNSLKQADAVLGTIVTDATGTGELVLEDRDSGSDYCLIQTKGAAGYDMLNEFIYKDSSKITEIDNGMYGTGTICTHKLENPKTEYGYGYLALYKMMTQTDTKAVTEEGAVFEILDAETKDVVDTLTTNANGTDRSIKLEAGRYILHQVSGADEYHQLVNDVYFTILETDQGTTYYPRSFNYNITASRNGCTYSEKDLADGDTYLDVEVSKTKGYVLNPENMVKIKLTKYDAEDMTHLLEGAVYALYDEKGEELVDENGIGVTFITDENGEAVFMADYGTYYIREKVAPADYARNTALMKMVVTADGVEISVQERGSSELQFVSKDVVTENGTHTADEIAALKQKVDALGVALETAKAEMDTAYEAYLVAYNAEDSSDIEVLTDAYMTACDAYYDAKKAHENALADGNYTDAELSVLETARNTAETNMNTAYNALKTANNDLAEAQKLYLEKTNAYTAAQREYSDALAAYESANMTSDIVICYNLMDKDNPIYATLAVNKTGGLLSGATTDVFGNTTFTYEEGALPGAGFALYAAEDIVSGDGKEIYHAKGEIVATGTTDENGRLQFMRQLDDGTYTKNLHLGAYYYVETKAPYGYALDNTEYFINLTDSTMAEQLGSVDIGQGIPETGETENPNMVLATYDLGTGVTATLFTTGILELSGSGTAPTYASVDDVPWYADGNHTKIQSVIAGPGVTFTKLDHYFYGCSELVSFEVKNEAAFTSLTSINRAFYDCFALEIVSNFTNCASLTDISYAFMNCYMLPAPPDFTGCNNITTSGYAFANCHSLTYKANIPVTVASTAYQNCYNITE